MKEIQEGLSSFFNGLRYYVNVSRDARKTLSVAIAPSFSVFDYIRPNENMLSEIIADLLDPKGSHGQGTVFLRRFLEMLNGAGCKAPDDHIQNLSESKIVCEAATSFLANSARRIDIRIRISRGCGIGIENKPRAVEQVAQLADYSLDLQRRYKVWSGLVFLCKSGRTPTSISKNKWKELRLEARCATVTYTGRFAKWLRTCHQICEAEKVRHFLKDFEKYVHENLGGSGIEEDQDDVQ